MTGITDDRLRELASETLGRLTPGLIIRVASMELTSEAPRPGITLGVEGEISIAVSPSESTSAIGCAVSYGLTARATTPDGEIDADADVFWEAKAAIHGQWSATDLTDLTDDHVRAFAIKVGVMALHPYARAQIQSMVVAAGWPPYAIDVIQSPEVLFADEDGQVDLEAVTLLDRAAG